MHLASPEITQITSLMWHLLEEGCEHSGNENFAGKQAKPDMLSHLTKLHPDSFLLPSDRKCHGRFCGHDLPQSEICRVREVTSWLGTFPCGFYGKKH